MEDPRSAPPSPYDKLVGLVEITDASTSELWAGVQKQLRGATRTIEGRELSSPTDTPCPRVGTTTPKPFRDAKTTTSNDKARSAAVGDDHEEGTGRCFGMDPVLSSTIHGATLCLDLLIQSQSSVTAHTQNERRTLHLDAIQDVYLALEHLIEAVHAATDSDCDCIIASFNGLTTGTANLCGSTWNSLSLTQLQDGEHGDDSLRKVLMRPMATALVLLHSRLKWETLDRWFTLRSGETDGNRVFSDASDYERFRKADEARPGMEPEVTSAVRAAFHAFGYETPSQLVELLMDQPTGLLSLVALVFLTAPSQINATQLYLDADTSKEDKRVLMDHSIPMLALAMGGAAEEAGCAWMWLIVDTIRMDRRWYGSVRDIWLKETTAQLVLDWIGPVVSKDPECSKQRALCRLISRIPRLAGSPDAWARLWDRTVSDRNPCPHARLVGLNAVCEDLGKVLRRNEVAYRTSFWKTLASTIFSLPNAKPDIRTASIQEIARSMHPAWIAGVRAVLSDFECRDADQMLEFISRTARKVPNVPEATRKRWDETARVNRGEDRHGVDVQAWVDEVDALVSKWERELEDLAARGTDLDEEFMHYAPPFFLKPLTLRGIIERMRDDVSLAQGYLGRVDKTGL